MLQEPTANLLTRGPSYKRNIDLSPCCSTARRLMLFNVVNAKGLADYNFAPFRRR